MPAFPGSGSSATPTATAGPIDRTLLHEGYGVHVGFLGHDLHGLRFGPDGKLYFSIGDRGFNVTTREGRALAVPDTGSVLRCNPDGTELEVFATGLRNPQELAFDEFGNLFTGDNNSDSGDRARWVYVVEGGDSGWRIGYQFIATPISRGPWNEEKLWYPAFAGQAAYIVPPIANLADGPSGLTYDPGVSLLPGSVPEPLLPGRFPRRQRPERDSQLRAQAQGGIVRAGRSPAIRLVGAGDRRRLRSRRSALFLRLGRGVGQAEQGADLPRARPVAARRPTSGRSRRCWPREWSDGRIDELAGLLAHPDMRVRQEAQFELASRGRGGLADAGPDRRVRGEPTWPGFMRSGAWARPPGPRRHGRRQQPVGYARALAR